MESTRQRLDRWVRRERWKAARTVCLVLAGLGVVLAIGSLGYGSGNPKKASSLHHAFGVAGWLLHLIGPYLIGSAIFLAVAAVIHWRLRSRNAD